MFDNLVGFSKVDFEDGDGGLGFKIECVLNDHENAAIRILLINYAGKQTVVGLERIRGFSCDSWQNHISFCAPVSKLIQLNKCPQIEIDNE